MTDGTSRSQNRQALQDLEHNCRDVDPGTLFFGPRKYIHDLWLIVHHQKHYIQALEDMLRIKPEIPGRAPDDPHTTVENSKLKHAGGHGVDGRVVGDVLGHENTVVQILQQHLQHQHVALDLQANQAVEPAGITLVFHRKKARLPRDEIDFMLAESSAQGPPGQIIVVFMHNVASGHEKSLFKPVGPNNTDPGCWSAFAQQCLLITDMTFDETRFDWNKINELALHLIVDAIINAARQTSSYNRRVKSATKQSNGSLQTASPSTRQYCPTSRPASHTCGFQ
ncbi:hypothetical protein ABBQ32_006496 [Trebouxia sp. C0010 RCD-2024]